MQGKSLATINYEQMQSFMFILARPPSYILSKDNTILPESTCMYLSKHSKTSSLLCGPPTHVLERVRKCSTSAMKGTTEIRTTATEKQTMGT